MSDVSSSQLKTYQPLINLIRQTFQVSDAEQGMIPLHAPCFDQTEKDAVVDCIDSTFVSSVGRYVDQFEQDVAGYTGAQYAVAAVNGTLGLYLALKTLDVAPGDLVLTQSLTFVATANAIKMAGAAPLFLDVAKTTMGLSLDSLAEFLSSQTHFSNQQCIHSASGQRISACMPMHTLGFACDIGGIVDVCHRYGIAVIEDAAESLGTTYESQHTGTFGDMGVFSFNGNKILTTGGGGMLVTHSERLAKRAKHLSTTAKIPHAWLFEHDEAAYNLRMPNLNAALGVAQLQKLESFLKQKRILAKKYQKLAEKVPGLVFFSDQNNHDKGVSNAWLNALVMETQIERDAFLKWTNDQAIQTRPLWTPMHQQAIYESAIRTELPNTEWFAERIVNIPSSVVSNLQTEDMQL